MLYLKLLIFYYWLQQLFFVDGLHSQLKIAFMDVKIEESWKTALKSEFTKPYFLQVATHLKTEKISGNTIYPPGQLIFNAFGDFFSRSAISFGR